MGRSSPSVAFMRYWAAGRIVRWSVSADDNEFDAEGGLASQMHVYGTICDLCIGSKAIVWHTHN